MGFACLYSAIASFTPKLNSRRNLFSGYNRHERLLPRFFAQKKEKSTVVIDELKMVEPDFRGDSESTEMNREIGQSEIDLLFDDGYGELTIKDYLDMAKEIIKPDGGPPRWFCPIDCGRPIKNAPLLLFLPGVDGVGLGLVLHHKALGKIFEVRCMHMPVYDRTPYEELVEFVENTVKFEHAICPNKPIYLVGDSFGGCLALSVAARNANLDLILILCNPATSFERSQLQPFLPLLELIPNDLHLSIPYLLSFTMGNPLKLVMVNVENDSPAVTLDRLSENLVSLLPRLVELSDILPKETLVWKLKLLKSAAAYANSRLHAVKAEVLVLSSGNDNMLPSKDEASRLYTLLPNCRVRYFKDNGHTLLFEDGINLLTIIKGTGLFRRSSKNNYVSDFLPPSRSEYNAAIQQNGWFRIFTSPVILSTLEDGTIVRGLAGVPNEGPVILVGYHMLMGLEVGPIVEEFLREKKVMIRGAAHPIFFQKEKKHESSLQESSFPDLLNVFGGFPVSASNMYRVLSSKSFVLLYPGGAREALHRKGEDYKLFWPEQPEFVRMAARFGATIVPFGSVGEDDIVELALDYNDLKKIPLIIDMMEELNESSTRIRNDARGEIVNQDLFFPILLPKIPGRFYYLFGKPIETKGKKEILKDKENANVLYLQIKSDIEKMIGYLKKKREEDPYRGILSRTIGQANKNSTDQLPTFNYDKIM